AIEVDDLLLRDFAHLLLRHFADEPAARGLRSRGRLLAEFEIGRLLEEEGHRRLAHLEGERAVLVGGDDHRDRRALLQLRGARVEGLAELHDVQAALAERGTDRRRRIGRARRHLQFDIAGNFVSHWLLHARTRASGHALKAHAKFSSSWCERISRVAYPGVLPRVSVKAGRLAGLRAGGKCATRRPNKLLKKPAA